MKITLLLLLPPLLGRYELILGNAPNTCLKSVGYQFDAGFRNSFRPCGILLLLNAILDHIVFEWKRVDFGWMKVVVT